MNLEKAYFVKMATDLKTEITSTKFAVQFNPESLKVTFANEIKSPHGAGDQRGPAAVQFVGSGTTKMAGQIWFDAGTNGTDDVRALTRNVVAFMTPQPISTPGPTQGLFSPAYVRFHWGTFIFQGILDSIEETIEYFSPDGKPQRASVSFSLVDQTIQFITSGQPAQANTPGNVPLTPSPQQGTPRANIQAMAQAAGRGSTWQPIAAANGIDNPRMLSTGQLIDMSADLTGGISVGAGTGAVGTVAVGVTGVLAGGISGNVSAAASVDASGSVGVSVGGTVAGGISGSVSASAGAMFTVG